MGSRGRRICVTGGRDLSDLALVEQAFADISLSPDDTVIEGEARGADLLCADVACRIGASVEPHPAKWHVYGGSAGVIRNTEMLRSGVDLLLSFPGGRGTRHCTNKAMEMGIPVVFVVPRSNPPVAPVVTEGEDPSCDADADGGNAESPDGDPWSALLSKRGTD